MESTSQSLNFPAPGDALPSQRWWSPTRELLVLYFSLLEQFQFTDAVNLLYALTEPSQDDAVWSFTPALQLFAGAEALYYNFAFLRLQEPAKVTGLYDSAMILLNKVTNDVEATLKQLHQGSAGRRDSRTNEDNQTALAVGWYAKLVKQLLMIIVIRKKVISVYQTLAKIGIRKEYDEEVQKLNSITLSAPDTITHPLLSQIRQNLLFEVLLLDKTLRCEMRVANYEPESALLHLHQLEADLAGLDAKFKFAKAPSSNGGAEGSNCSVIFAQLPLAKFFFRLRDVFREKFCLYFGGMDMDPRLVSIISSVREGQTTFRSLMSQLVESTPCKDVAVILEPTKQQLKRQSGLVAWPALFSFPSLLDPCLPATFLQPVAPKDHWPNLISLIQDHEDILSDETYELPFHYFDPKVRVTYFIRRLQNRILLVAIFGEQQDPLDETIVGFFSRIVSFVRLRTACLPMM